MPEWVIPLLTAIGGAAVALIGREFIEWCRRPKLEMDFDTFPDMDFNDYEAQAEGYHGGQAVYKAKFLRLVVKNKGKNTALKCEAKLLLINDDRKYSSPVHWTKRDPILYQRFENGKKVLELDKIFAPIDISRSNSETLEVIKFPYWYSIAMNADHSSKRDIQYISLPPPLNNLMLLSDEKYTFEITVYAHNAKAVNFKFHCKWDGTIEGFDKAFTRD